MKIFILKTICSVILICVAYTAIAKPLDKVLTPDGKFYVIKPQETLTYQIPVNPAHKTLPNVFCVISVSSEVPKLTTGRLHYYANNIQNPFFQGDIQITSGDSVKIKLINGEITLASFPFGVIHFLNNIFSNIPLVIECHYG